MHAGGGRKDFALEGGAPGLLHWQSLSPIEERGAQSIIACVEGRGGGGDSLLRGEPASGISGMRWRTSDGFQQG